MKTPRVGRGGSARAAHSSARRAPAVVGVLALAFWASCGAQGQKNTDIITTGGPPVIGSQTPTGDGTPDGIGLVNQTCTGPTCDLGGTDDTSNLAAPAGCGDGVLTSDEA